MGPLFLRGFIGFVLTVIAAIVLTSALVPKPKPSWPKNMAVTASHKRLVNFKLALSTGRGPLRHRARRFRRDKPGLRVRLCPLKGGKSKGTTTWQGKAKGLSSNSYETVWKKGRGFFLRAPVPENILNSAPPPRRPPFDEVGPGSDVAMPPGPPPGRQAMCVRVKQKRNVHRERQFAVAVAVGTIGGLVLLLLPLTRRLRRIEAVVRRIAGGDLRARTRDDSSDAVGSLAQSVDQIGERIEALLASQRQMHASVSHELRTPLARLAAAIDLAEDHPKVKLFDGMRTDIRELDLLVEELLTLARLQDPSARAALSDIDLTRLGRGRIDAAKRGDQRQLHWSFEADDNLHLRGDARLLARLLDNLLNNAARHADSCVSLRLSKTDAGTLIEIADDGPGIPEEQRPTLFDPFVSVSPGGSAGLGLAICREIADLHRGTLSVATSDLGGASFRLVLA